ncbi:MAG: hypothetical protein IT536_07790 [Hyphomicrobiales bacterium]|nr:hypothetical protein [Hyphomicrobiales bacterium]
MFADDQTPDDLFLISRTFADIYEKYTVPFTCMKLLYFYTKIDIVYDIFTWRAPVLDVADPQALEPAVIPSYKTKPMPKKPAMTRG